MLPQYLYFYLIDSYIIYLIGVWLLVVTILLVHLILGISLNLQGQMHQINYTRKTQNI